jgi:hypothetical protein
MMEWILILNFLSGPVILPRAFPNEQECVGAGEQALPQCTATSGVFGDVREICIPRRFTCVAQPRIRAPNPIIRARPVCPLCAKPEKRLE